AAAMRQPAHDELVAADELLPVDAQVLAPGTRAARDGQPPGEQGSHVLRPAMLQGNAAEVNVIALDDDLLAGRPTDAFRAHVPQGRFQRIDRADGLTKITGRFGLTQAGQQTANVA